MKILDFYKAAMNAGLFKKKAWVISAFSIINEDNLLWKKNPYSYRIVQTSTGYFFCDPSKNNELSLLEDCKVGEPPLTFRQPITMLSGSMVNLYEDIETTIGNIFFNYCCILNSFNKKIDFIKDAVSISNIESILANRLEDNDSKKSDAILVDEYLTFVNSVAYLTNFTQLCVWASTAKSMTAPPGVVEFKQKLLDKYKGQLHDATIVAQIESELVKYDAEYLKGDPCENFLISKKSRNIVRKKMFLMGGAEAGISEKIDVDLIENSLAQGWQIDKFATMNNTLRAGSFNRGAETQLGGESVKWLLRASSNITATVEDCGAKLGKTISITNENINKLIGFSVLENNLPILVNNVEEAGKYLGSTIMVRSPMYCKLDKTDYCLICVGKKLAQNPTAISMAVSEYGSSFLSLFMKKMHGTALLLAKMDYKQAIT